MGKKQTADGRWIIGGGENSTDYKGFLHWRECYICLTEDGATDESVDYLNALKDYALAHYALGEPIMPPSMTVWVVANGKTTAVQADDVKVEDGDYTICGITYSDGAWDYSNAGQRGGGSSLPAVTSEDNGDVLTVVDGEWGKAAPSGGGGDMLVVTITQDPISQEFSADKTLAEILAAKNNGTPVIGILDVGYDSPVASAVIASDDDYNDIAAFKFLVVLSVYIVYRPVTFNADGTITTVPADYGVQLAPLGG